MNLSIEEFKELTAFLEKPIEIIVDKSSSVTIRCKIKKGSQEELQNPLKIDKEEINHLGIYDINGIKFWIVKE